MLNSIFIVVSEFKEDTFILYVLPTVTYCLFWKAIFYTSKNTLLFITI